MSERHRDIVVIGASAGGVEALQGLIGGLPASFPAAVFIVLHIWQGSHSFLPDILGRAGQLPVSEAVHGAEIKTGTIVVAPPDMHLMLENGHVAVVRGPRENRTRPAINPLFRSAALAFRNRVTGVILTGTLDDGSAGLWSIKQCGGVAIVQSDAVFDQMPRSALENVEVDYHVPLDQIPSLLVRLTGQKVTVSDPGPVLDVIRVNDEGTKMKTTGFDIDHLGRRSIFSCPECNGALWELDTGGLQFRCHVGHGYSAAGLKQEQFSTIEQSLWSAIRALKESAGLDERLAERSKQHNLDKAEALHWQNRSEKLAHVQRLQEFMQQFRVEQGDSG